MLYQQSIELPDVTQLDGWPWPWHPQISSFSCEKEVLFGAAPYTIPINSNCKTIQNGGSTSETLMVRYHRFSAGSNQLDASHKLQLQVHPCGKVVNLRWYPSLMIYVPFLTWISFLFQTSVPLVPLKSHSCRCNLVTFCVFADIPFVKTKNRWVICTSTPRGRSRPLGCVA